MATVLTGEREVTEQELEQHFAMHEAGHAVTAYILKHGPGRVCLQRENGALVGGFCEVWEKPFEYTMQAYTTEAQRVRRLASLSKRNQAVIYLAGFVAEGIAFGEIYEPGLAERDQVETLLRTHTARGKTAYLAAWRRTEKTLASHWPAVDAVATALRQRQELSQEEACTIIRQALKNKRATPQ